ncbi:class I SAM-dependent methyltransferase [Chroococcidiopsis sp. SAG 2025]|uniref:class I SAM-dependent methyltransferase n=1 Tax=Chroococcidiopsis sp. SAG 2025 TaxID=171389 RepID=UPI0029370D86|nr:class I SAM-dependent methyltransferase [Chroococcidiopsis sp. SAG 2025]
MTVEQVKEAYEIEKQLARILRNSTRQERQRLQLYTSLYDEFFQKVPSHTQLKQKLGAETWAEVVAQTMQFLKRFLKHNSTFLEIGAGDCSVSLEVAKYVEKAYAVDVSNEVTKGLKIPPNCEVVVSDGVSIPVPVNSVDIVYSNQLMEHLHPDDAFDQLKNIYKALKPGGLYICSTPNRLSGPHDVSQCFDEIATGFHLREYLISELYKLFCEVGFSRVIFCKSQKRIHLELPLNPIVVSLIQVSEKVIGSFPYAVRRKVANRLIVFRGMTIIGRK